MRLFRKGIIALLFLSLVVSISTGTIFAKRYPVHQKDLVASTKTYKMYHLYTKEKGAIRYSGEEYWYYSSNGKVKSKHFSRKASLTGSRATYDSYYYNSRGKLTRFTRGVMASNSDLSEHDYTQFYDYRYTSRGTLGKGAKRYIFYKRKDASNWYKRITCSYNSKKNCSVKRKVTYRTKNFTGWQRDYGKNGHYYKRNGVIYVNLKGIEGTRYYSITKSRISYLNKVARDNKLNYRYQYTTKTDNYVLTFAISNQTTRDVIGTYYGEFNRIVYFDKIVRKFKSNTTDIHILAQHELVHSLGVSEYVHYTKKGYATNKVWRWNKSNYSSMGYYQSKLHKLTSIDIKEIKRIHNASIRFPNFAYN